MIAIVRDRGRRRVKGRVTGAQVVWDVIGIVMPRASTSLVDVDGSSMEDSESEMGGDDGVCVRCDRAKVARAVGAATEGIDGAAGDADVYAFAPDTSADGGGMEIDLAGSGREQRSGVSDRSSGESPGERTKARHEMGSTSGTKRVERAGDPSAPEGSMEEPYARFEDLFGANELFLKSSSRARAAQVDMYVQDYLERKVYGYAHVKIRRKLANGRGVRARREVTMERRTVGVGRPEDAFEFVLGENPACAVRHPPVQSLPTTISMARGEKASEVKLPATYASRREGPPKTAVTARPPTLALATPKVPAAGLTKMRKSAIATKKEARSKKGSAVDLARVAQTQAKPMSMAQVATRAAQVSNQSPMSPEKRVKIAARDKTPQSMPDLPVGTIFDGDFVTDADADMAFWSMINNMEHQSPMRFTRGEREGTESPSRGSDKTASPKSTAQISAVERRVRALEAKLASGKFRAAHGLHPSATKGHSSEDDASAERSPALPPLEKPAAKSSPTIDDTARASAENKPLSSDGDKLRQATSAPSKVDVVDEVHSLKVIIADLQRRQDSFEVERRRYQEQLLDMANLHKERIASLESTIDAYETKFKASAGTSPHTPAYESEHNWQACQPARFSGGRPGAIPRHHDTAGPSRYPNEMRDSFHPRAPFSDPRDLMDREVRHLERTLAQKNKIIASLAGQLGSTNYDRWDYI